MQTFDCPKCGAPVTYDPNTAGGTARIPTVATSPFSNPDGIAFGMVFNDKNELLMVAWTKVMKFVLNQ